jgi:hypothetical protein
VDFSRHDIENAEAERIRGLRYSGVHPVFPKQRKTRFIPKLASKDTVLSQNALLLEAEPLHQSDGSRILAVDYRLNPI